MNFLSSVSAFDLVVPTFYFSPFGKVTENRIGQEIFTKRFSK